MYINRTVYVNNTTVNRISYNGGPNGIRVAPTVRQLAVARIRHIQATPLQLQHLRVASQDRRLLAVVNHGKPPIIAAQRPFTPTRRPVGFVAVRPADKTLVSHIPVVVRTNTGVHALAGHPMVLHPAYRAPVHTMTSTYKAPVHTTTSTYHAPVHTMTSTYKTPVHTTTSTYHAPVHTMTSTYKAPVRTTTPTYHAPVHTMAPTYKAPVHTMTPTYHASPVYHQQPVYHAPVYHAPASPRPAVHSAPAPHPQPAHTGKPPRG